jgi:inhibitor of KinA
MYPCGDHAITVELGAGIDIEVNRKVIAVADQIRRSRIRGVKDIIPAYCTVTVVYDIEKIDKAGQPTSYQSVCISIEKAISETVVGSVNGKKLLEVPVCYDPSLAPDIIAVAEMHGITTDELIGLHCGTIYHVYMTGFLPGFAYMGKIDDKIVTRRRSAPRTVVPAGSVGIAGEQTGVYPLDSPGGWQLIGQTPLTVFCADRERPCYFEAGDAVQFYPVSLDEFKKIKQP